MFLEICIASVHDILGDSLGRAGLVSVVQGVMEAGEARELYSSINREIIMVGLHMLDLGVFTYFVLRSCWPGS